MTDVLNITTMVKNILKIIAVSGIFLFIYYFIREGPQNIWMMLKGLSFFNLLILIFLRFLYWLVRSLNWYMVMRTFGSPPLFFKIFMARLGGHSVGYLTPTAKIGGEVIRVFLLGKTNKKKLTASVVIDKMTEFFAGTLVISSGVIIAVFVLPIARELKILLLIFTLSLFIFLLFFFIKQKGGLFLWFTKKIKIGRKFTDNKKEAILDTDRYISEFYKNETGISVFLVLSNIFNYLLWIVEIYLTLRFLGSPGITIFKSFLIASLGSFAFIFPFLPGSLGIFEATYLGLFKIFHIGQVVGIGYIITRRALGLIYAGIGLIPLLRSGFKREKIDL